MAEAALEAGCELHLARGSGGGVGGVGVGGGVSDGEELPALGVLDEAHAFTHLGDTWTGQDRTGRQVRIGQARTGWGRSG